MSMSKVDFEVLAVAFKRELELYARGTQQRQAAVAMIGAAAKACALRNENFDKARFFEACGVTKEDLS